MINRKVNRITENKSLVRFFFLKSDKTWKSAVLLYSDFYLWETETWDTSFVPVKVDRSRQQFLDTMPRVAGQARPNVSEKYARIL